MAINIVNVEQVLADHDGQPLNLVALHALNTVREPYRTILLQPQDEFEASEERVGHAKSDMGAALCSDFLSKAVENKADLAVAPEYCVPWSVVDEIIEGKYRPDPGGIWVLGCESIKPTDLQTVAAEFNKAGRGFFYHETLDPRQVTQKRYVDPLLYVFWAKNESGDNVFCLLVQFKTVPCKDFRDVEQTSLCVGKQIYAFNRGLGQIGLLSIICSDALDFTPYVEDSHPNCLLIHIQLNPKPAHDDYAAYRMKLCSVGSNSNVELLCLNWTQKVKEQNSANQFLVAGSAWYVPPAKYNCEEGHIDTLHKVGVYYNILKERWHSFFFNFEGQVLLIQKQKILFTGDQALVPKSCLAVIQRWSWSEANTTWETSNTPNDGFATVLGPYTTVAGPLSNANKASPLAVERALEILVGPKGKPSSWFDVNELEAVHLDKDEESIRRVTVHQEVSLSRAGVKFRKLRLQRAQDAVNLPGNGVPWPEPVRDLEQGFQLYWKKINPHHNVLPTEGNREPASLVYLADEADDAVIELVRKKMLAAIISHATSVAMRDSLNGAQLTEHLARNQDRLCVVYRRNNKYETCRVEGINFTEPVTKSAVNISGN